MDNVDLFAEFANQGMLGPCLRLVSADWPYLLLVWSVVMVCSILVWRARILATLELNDPKHRP